MGAAKAVQPYAKIHCERLGARAQNPRRSLSNLIHGAQRSHPRAVRASTTTLAWSRITHHPCPFGVVSQWKPRCMRFHEDEAKQIESTKPEMIETSGHSRKRCGDIAQAADAGGRSKC
jgi:hypothetical protein